MMKLWVDDIRNAPDESWHVARTALEAIRAIARYDFEIISLDHDISHQVSMGPLGRPYPCEETFASVAFYIVQKYLAIKRDPEAHPIWEPLVRLHTSNEVAGDEMFRVLSENGLYAEKKYMGAVNRLEMEI